MGLNLMTFKTLITDRHGDIFYVSYGHFCESSGKIDGLKIDGTETDDTSLSSEQYMLVVDAITSNESRYNIDEDVACGVIDAEASEMQREELYFESS